MSSNNRRILKSRDTAWAQRCAQCLAAKNIAPNHISLFSLICAIGASAALMHWHIGGPIWLAVIALVGIQGRLLCNLLDGMVAIEGEKASINGEFYNDIPDRIADVLLFAAVGLAAGQLALGLMVGIACMGTAYVRYLCHTVRGVMPFAGPMGKQHRMAVLTITILVRLFVPSVYSGIDLFTLMLWLVLAGSILTMIRRVFQAASTPASPT